MMKYLKQLLQRAEGFSGSGLRRTGIPLTLIILTLIITLTGGCENEPDVLGLDLLPDSIRAYTYNSEVIHAFTREADSLVTNLKADYLLGHHIHPTFGKTTARLVTEFNLIDYGSYSFGAEPAADSVILRFDISDYTGDLLSPVLFYVYEYEEEIRTDTSIYSNMDMDGKFNPVILGTGEIITKDSVLKIFIEDQDYIDKFLFAQDTIFKDNDYLQTDFKGLYIVPEHISGEGVMIDLDFTSLPGILGIYYRNAEEDSLEYFLEIGGSTSKKFNLFEYDFTETPLKDNLNNGNGPDSMVYIGSPGLVNAIIRFPELSAWLDSMPIAINHAELIITPVDTLESGLNTRDYPVSLDLFRYGEGGIPLYIYDYMLDQNTFGGNYDSESSSYRFSLKVHFQSYLNGEVENIDLILLPGSNAETYKQLIIYGGNSFHADRMKLEIVYTLL